MMLFSNVLLNFVYSNLQPLVFAILITLLLHKWLKQSKKYPPGPIGLPLLGYLPFLGDEPHKQFKELGKKYGDIISFRLGRSLAVVLNEYEVMKEVLCHASALNREPEFLNHVEERGFFSTNGEAWQEQRRFCVQSTKDLGLGTSNWEKMIEEELSIFLEELSSHKGQPILITDPVSTSAASNIIALLIGRRLDNVTESDKMSLMVRFMYEVLDNVGLSNPISLMPRVRKIFEYLGVGNYRKVARTIQEFRNFVKEEIVKHRSQMEEHDTPDFMDLYLRKIKEKSLQQSRHYFSDFNLLGNMFSLFVGGSETISTSLEWILALMAAHQDVQEKVYVELNEVLGRDGKISYNERFKLPYTLATVMESMRWASIVRLNPSRCANADIEFNGYTIPKGSHIIGNLWAVHRDPKYWPDPEKFDPDRFLNEKKTEVVKNPPSFAPFSLGRRNCPGEKVAYMEILLFFTSVIQKFHITPPPGEEIKFEDNNGVVCHLKPQKLCFFDRAEVVKNS